MMFVTSFAFELIFRPHAVHQKESVSCQTASQRPRVTSLRKATSAEAVFGFSLSQLLMSLTFDLSDPALLFVSCHEETCLFPRRQWSLIATRLEVGFELEA